MTNECEVDYSVIGTVDQLYFLLILSQVDDPQKGTCDVPVVTVPCVDGPTTDGVNQNKTDGRVCTYLFTCVCMCVCVCVCACACAYIRMYVCVYMYVCICDRAYENRSFERKLHRVISSIPNAVSHFHKLQKKAH